MRQLALFPPRELPGVRRVRGGWVVAHPRSPSVDLFVPFCEARRISDRLPPGAGAAIYCYRVPLRRRLAARIRLLIER